MIMSHVSLLYIIHVIETAKLNNQEQDNVTPRFSLFPALHRICNRHIWRKNCMHKFGRET